MHVFLSRRAVVSSLRIEQYVLKEKGVGKGESCQKGKSNVKMCLLKIPRFIFISCYSHTYCNSKEYSENVIKL